MAYLQSCIFLKFLDVCEKDIHFCSDVYRRCELCSDYPQDCFTLYHHKVNCTNYCKNQMLASLIKDNQTENDTVSIPVWIFAIVVAVILLAVLFVVLRMKRKSIRECCFKTTYPQKLNNHTVLMNRLSNQNLNHQPGEMDQRQVADGGIEIVDTESMPETTTNPGIPNPNVIPVDNNSSFGDGENPNRVEADINVTAAPYEVPNDMPDDRPSGSASEYKLSPKHGKHKKERAVEHQEQVPLLNQPSQLESSTFRKTALSKQNTDFEQTTQAKQSAQNKQTRKTTLQPLKSSSDGALRPEQAHPELSLSNTHSDRYLAMNCSTLTVPDSGFETGDRHQTERKRTHSHSEL